MILSRQQSEVMVACRRWMRSSDQTFVLYGYAGTGKTTIARQLVSDASGLWLFGAYTGKAAHVLRQKGCDASTLHSLIYRPSGDQLEKRVASLSVQLDALDILAENRELTREEKDRADQLRKMIENMRADDKPSFAIWDGSPLADPQVEGIVVDEVSMVGEKLGRDLESFGKKILVIGDPFQLPPVRTGGYLTSREPNYVLTEVHRQARDSDVLRLATHIRQGGSLDDFVHGGAVRYADKRDKEVVRDVVVNSDQVLCGRNHTRVTINNRVRQVRGARNLLPVDGDKLVCRRNNRRAGLFNGSLWWVDKVVCDVGTHTAIVDLRPDDDMSSPVSTEIWLHNMTGRGEELRRMGEGRRDFDLFDYGYALTVHSSQGSQWSGPVLYDEPDVFKSIRSRWLYTAVTRASDTITIVR